MQVFGLTENTDFKALLEVECKEIFGLSPVVHQSIDDLRYVFSIFEVIDVVIVDIPLDSLKSRSLETLLTLNQHKIKKIYVYGDQAPDNKTFKFFYRTEIAELFEEVKRSSGPKLKSPESWTSVPVCTLIHFHSLPFDLYIKLSDQKYVKRVPAYEAVGAEILNSFSEKGISHLYCESKYKRDFSMMLINNMINKVDRTYSSHYLAQSAQDEVLKTTKEIIQSLGLTGRIIEVCQASIERMQVDVLKEKDQFSEYLLSLHNNPNLTFHFKLISLTNYIGTQIIMEMDLPLVEEQVSKFIFASYFCDMTIKNPAFLYHRKSEDAGALDLDEQNEVNFHALKASEMVAMKEISKEVALIIKQHHGSFSGIGFPLEKSNQLLPLSKVLIVSQDLAFSILSNMDMPALEVLKGILSKIRTESLHELLIILERSLGLNAKVTA